MHLKLHSMSLSNSQPSSHGSFKELEVAHSTDNVRRFDFINFLIEDLYFYSYSIACICNQLIHRFLESVQLTGLVDAVNAKLEDHPIIKFAFFGIVSSFAVPILLFLVFAVVSIIFTFAGFVFIEGIILAAGILCMCICLISMIMVISVMAIVLGMFYILITKLQLTHE